MKPKQKIEQWLDAIGENDPQIRTETIERCRRELRARAYFLARREVAIERGEIDVQEAIR